MITERVLDGPTVHGSRLHLLDITVAGPPVRDDVFDSHARTAVRFGCTDWMVSTHVVLPVTARLLVCMCNSSTSNAAVSYS